MLPSPSFGTSDAERIALVLGGKKVGGRWMARCPVHQDRRPSLSLRDGDVAVLVHCYAGCSRVDILRELARKRLLPGDPRSHERPVVNQRVPRPDMSTLEAILARSRPIGGSPVATYLQARGCAEPNSGDLRYLPPCEPYPWPTMLGVVSDFLTGACMTLHFTSLSESGQTKAPIETPKRLLRGYRKAGGVVRLTDDAEVPMHLGIAEGIETALAVTAALGEMAHWLPIWAAIDAGNLAALPVAGGVERLTIFADTDNNGVGQAAARELAARWSAAGRQVFIAQPPAPPGRSRDWNSGVTR